MMSKVSIIVPVYNASKYLKTCMNSLVNQTLDGIEIIAIDDGSQDNSSDILEQYKDNYQGKVKIIHTLNNGVGAARNKGLDLAGGEFVKFVDADDYLNLDILERMYIIAKENGVSLVRGNYLNKIGVIQMNNAGWNQFNTNQIVNISENKDYIVTENPGIGNKLMSRDLIGDLRFPEQTKWEDLGMIPATLAGAERIAYLNEPVYHYRMHLNTTVKDFLKPIPNIFDIIHSLNHLEKGMKKLGVLEDYQQQMLSIYALHTLFRVENVIWWPTFSKDKKEKIVSNLTSVLDLTYPNWREDKMVEQFKVFNPFFGRDMKRLVSYEKDIYKVGNQEDAENQIQKVFVK